MAFLSGLVGGYADTKAEQMRTNEQRYQEMLETYRARALEAHQTYNKAKQAQQTQLRGLKNFAAQHFDGDMARARSFVDLYGGDIPEAHKAILDRGAPTWSGSTDQQMANAGLADSSPVTAQGQASGQAVAMGDPMRAQTVEQAPQAQQQAQQQPANEGEQGLLDTLGNFIQERTSRIFNPPGMPEVRQQVAEEMGMSVEQLNSLMSYDYNLDPGYTPVAMEHPRLGISDLSNAENTLIRDAYVRGGPDAAVAAAQQIQDRKDRRAENAGKLNEQMLARLLGIDPTSAMPTFGTVDSTQQGPAGQLDRSNQSSSAFQMPKISAAMIPEGAPISVNETTGERAAYINGQWHSVEE